jgi:hypothetical protein
VVVWWCDVVVLRKEERKIGEGKRKRGRRGLKEKVKASGRFYLFHVRCQERFVPAQTGSRVTPEA